jgi:hypothetical protein
MPTEKQQENSLIPLFMFGVPAGIGLSILYNRLKAKLEKREARLTAVEFADKYIEQKALAAKGNAPARTFMEVANRRLKHHRDEAVLGNNESKTFLDNLRTRGITEADYLK